MRAILMYMEVVGVHRLGTDVYTYTPQRLAFRGGRNSISSTFIKEV